MGSTETPLNGALLTSVLLDFQASPGRFPVRLHQPRLLFERALEVLQLAAGRLTLPAFPGSPPPQTVQRAARFFVRHAFLRQGADHYSLLGLSQEATDRTIRDHYRLLIRLTHPDFEIATEAWPADAAARVNLAYGVLSTPDQREQYDLEFEQLTAPTGYSAHQPDRATGRTGITASSSHSNHKQPPGARSRMGRQWLVGHKAHISTGVSVMAGLALLVLFLMGSPSEEESLRAAPMVAAQPAESSRIARLKQEAASLEASLSALSHRTSLAAPKPEKHPPTNSAVAETRTSSSSQKVTKVLPTINDSAPSTTVQRLPVTSSLGTSPEDAPLALGLSLSLPVAPPSSNATPTGRALDSEKVATISAAPSALQRPSGTAASTKTPSNDAPLLDMKPLQPLFASLIESLLSGDSNDVLRWTQRSSEHISSAPAFADAYKKALGEARIVGLGQVSLSPQSRGEQQMVSGVVQMRLEHADRQTSVKNFRLRAYFSRDASGFKLTEMVAE